MKTPFTSTEFFDVFEAYNKAVYPMQIVFYLLAAVVIYLSIRKIKRSDKIISTIIGFMWLYMGVIYHLIFFSAINKAAYLFGAFFIIQSLMWFYYGVVKNKIFYHFSRKPYGIIGAIMMLYALLVYPILGAMNGHIYPASPTFGLPCPTTIFTFGLLLWTDKHTPARLVIIPFIWSLIGFSAAISLGVLEDAALPLTGLIATWMILRGGREVKFNSPQQTEIAL